MAVQSAKGNPASHRMSNQSRSSLRDQSWLRGEARKVERRKAQESAAARNKRLRADGKLTPWQEAKKARFARRHQGVAA